MKKRRFQKIGKFVVLGSILVIGLSIVNMGRPINLFDSITATTQDYEYVAANIENYIIAEYEKQKELGEVNLASIVKKAEMFDTLGLTINYSEGYVKSSVVILKDLDNKVIQLKKIELD